MLITLIVSALAGFGARPFEPKLTEFLERHLDKHQMPDATGRAVAAFALALFAASVLLVLIGDTPSAVLIIAGGIAGYFHAELREAVTSRRP